MKKAMIAVAALAASGTAFAGAHESGGGNGPDWTFVDVGYWTSSTIGSGFDTEGFNISGSIGFAEKWHARAVYSDGEVQGGADTGFGVDTDGYAVIIGGHPAVSENTDLVFEIGYFDEDVESETVTGSQDGYTITAGIRSMVFDNVELLGAITSVDADIEGIDARGVRGTLGGQYYFTDNVSVGAAFTISDLDFESQNTANFNLRYNF